MGKRLAEVSVTVTAARKIHSTIFVKNVSSVSTILQKQLDSHITSSITKTSCQTLPTLTFRLANLWQKTL